MTEYAIGVDSNMKVARKKGKKMAKTITRKIIEEHLVSGSLIPGTEIAIKTDQTLTQDATGTMAYLQFESLKTPGVKTEQYTRIFSICLRDTG